ncbi:MAG: NAD(P)/FAD-dependent oxidoreductase [Gammaproteobacteria bacterium]
MNAHATRHVVIIGGGFAGLRAARVLGKCESVEITVVDRTNHHVFQPLLYQVATAALSPSDIARPIRNILARNLNTEVLQATVHGINLSEQQITTTCGPVAYDYLIVTAGGINNYFTQDNWAALARGLKTLNDAVHVRNRILTAFEKAEREPDPVKQKQLLTFVIVGGSYTGVELSGAIAELARFTLVREFRHIKPDQMRVVLVEAGPRILPAMSAESSQYAAQVLTDLGVDVLTGSMMTKLDASGLELRNHHIRAATLLWAAGIRASPLDGLAEVPQDDYGRIYVASDLSIKSHPEVFVAGDMAYFPAADGRPLPAVAPVAFQQGAYLGRLILRELRGQRRKPFRYFDKGQLAAIGRNRAVAEIGRLRIRGRFAWLIWVTIHIYYLTDFRNRQLVLLRWAWAYFTHWRGARLILPESAGAAELDNEG